MQHQKKLHECEPDDPGRCQGMMNGEQCRFLSMKAMKERGLIPEEDARDFSQSTNCPKHGGVQIANKVEKEKVRNYRLQIWQERMDEFTENEEVKSLREEIGILRLLIENLLNQCHNATDLMLYSSKISELVMKVEKVVSSANRLESNMGMLLDRGAALAMGQRIVEVVSTHVPDDQVIDKISEGIIDVIAHSAKAEREFENALLE